MGFRSYKDIETDEKFTFLTGMSTARALAGLALGGLMIAHSIDATVAFSLGVAADFTDMEGSLYLATRRFPDLQRDLRITPTKFGGEADAIADKIFHAGFIIGAFIAGYIPTWATTSIMGTETVTAAVTLDKKRRGAQPRSSRIGAAGLIGRGLAVADFMAIHAFASSSHFAHEILSNSANVTTALAVALGAASCALLARTPVPKAQQELLPDTFN